MDKNLLAETLLNMISSALLVFDESGAAVKHNRSWEQLADGLELASYGSSIKSFIDITGLIPIANGERERVSELSYKGRTLLVHQRACNIGNSECISMQIDDITALKEAIGSMANKTQQALWRIRSRATGIQNALRLLTEYSPKALGSEEKSLLQDSLYETWQLARYCNNLRDIIALEFGIIEIDFETFSLEQAVEAAVGNVKLYADCEHKTCVFDTSIGGIQVYSDWNRLVHIIDAILLNSVVYSNSEVRVNISAQRDADQVILSIKDNGMGIDEDELPKVFLPGFRGENANKVQYNGMGMELYLVRQMLIRMYGSINIISSKAAGTTVELILPGEKNHEK